MYCIIFSICLLVRIISAIQATNKVPESTVDQSALDAYDNFLEGSLINFTNANFNCFLTIH